MGEFLPVMYFQRAIRRFFDTGRRDTVHAVHHFQLRHIQHGVPRGTDIADIVRLPSMLHEVVTKHDADHRRCRGKVVGGFEGRVAAADDHDALILVGFEIGGVVFVADSMFDAGNVGDIRLDGPGCHDQRTATNFVAIGQRQDELLGLRIAIYIGDARVELYPNAEMLAEIGDVLGQRIGQRE